MEHKVVSSLDMKVVQKEMGEFTKGKIMIIELYKHTNVCIKCLYKLNCLRFQEIYQACYAFMALRIIENS